MAVYHVIFPSTFLSVIIVFSFGFLEKLPIGKECSCPGLTGLSSWGANLSSGNFM